MTRERDPDTSDGRVSERSALSEEKGGMYGDTRGVPSLDFDGSTDEIRDV